METWKAALSDDTFEDYIVRRCEKPSYNEDDKIECLRCCNENKCGCYGSTWACPPGFSMDVKRLYDDTDYVILVQRTFCLDVKDKEVVDSTSVEMQRIVRLMVTNLRQYGLDCIGFADGACHYCGVCSYPEECRYPDMLVPSISSLGLNMGKYLGDMGMNLSFCDDCITLYGLIFVNTKDDVSLIQ